MMTFAEAGIALHVEREGKHRLPCPECDKSRHDSALEVTITPKRWAFWKCFRCDWEGKAPLDDLPPERRERHPLRLVAPSPAPVQSGLAAKAQAILRGCRPITTDSPPANYLHGRGCALPENDVLWHPAHRHPSGYVGPAIVALVTDVLTGERISLHQTWLAPDGSGKAAIDKPRLLLKGHRKHGGVVRLFPDEEVTTGLAIAEGIETALSAAHGFSPIWACIDASNMGAFPVLGGVESLTVVVDNDKAGLAAFNAVAATWNEAGREVRYWRAPDHGQDINDWIGAAA